MRYDERGSTTPLIVGFFVLLAVMVAVVTDASAAYLQRSGLDSVADGAALAATQGVGGLYEHGLDDGTAPFDEPSARSRVADYLARVAARERFPGLEHAIEVRGDRVVVHVRAPLDLPLAVPGGPERAMISSTGSAVIAVSR